MWKKTSPAAVLEDMWYIWSLWSVGEILPGGWQGLGAPAGCQAWASEVGETNSGHWTSRDHPAPRIINRWEFSQRPPSRCYDPAPPNGQQTPVLEAPCKTTSKTGTQLHPLAERLHKIIRSSPQNIPPDAALPTRNTRSSPTHQNTGTSPLHQEAYKSHWTNLTHRRQTPKTTETMNLQPAERRPQTQ